MSGQFGSLQLSIPSKGDIFQLSLCNHKGCRENLNLYILTYKSSRKYLLTNKEEYCPTLSNNLVKFTK